MIIGLDFDGTLFSHAYPHVGYSLGAEPYLRELADIGCRFVLFTMRDGEHLVEAVRYCRDVLAIEFYGINTNPAQHGWTMSPKAFCHLYIDDAALGAPLKPDACGRPAIDWSLAGPMALEKAMAWFDAKESSDSDDAPMRPGRYFTGERI